MNEEWHSYRLMTNQDISFQSFYNINSVYDWDVTKTWSVARESYSYLSNSKYCELVVTIRSKNGVRMAAYKAGIKIGDIIYFEDPTDGIHHAAIVVSVKDGEIYYAAHSTGRMKKALSTTIGNDTIRIVKIK